MSTQLDSNTQTRWRTIPDTSNERPDGELPCLLIALGHQQRLVRAPSRPHRSELRLLERRRMRQNVTTVWHFASVFAVMRFTLRARGFASHERRTSGTPKDEHVFRELTAQLDDDGAFVVRMSKLMLLPRIVVGHCS